MTDSQLCKLVNCLSPVPARKLSYDKAPIMSGMLFPETPMDCPTMAEQPQQEGSVPHEF